MKRERVQGGNFPDMGAVAAYVIFLYQMKQPTVSPPPASLHFLHHFYPETEQSGWQALDTVKPKRMLKNLKYKIILQQLNQHILAT